jgi:hypothetical protein
LDEDSVGRRARERFAELDGSNLPPIRRDVREGWVARGSLHVIADRLESAGTRNGSRTCAIGWEEVRGRRLRQRRTAADRTLSV